MSSNLPNLNALLMQGFQTGREMKRQEGERNALAGLFGAGMGTPGQTPGIGDGVGAYEREQEALTELARYNPQMAMQVRKYQQDQREYQRGESFRNALIDYGPVNAPGGRTTSPSNENYNPYAASGEHQTLASAAQPSHPVRSAKDEAFLRMWEADPVKAMEIDSKLRDQALGRVKVVREAYAWAAQQLGGVTDDAGYQAVKKGFADQMASLGIDVPQDGIPPTYPGPDGMRKLLMRALEADKQLAALDRSDRLAWDIEDDIADNERSDRNTDSLIADRTARRGLVARGQDLTDARGRRGQDIASTDRRRGQDMTDIRVRETGGGKKAGAGEQVIVDVRTPDEARKLKPGTVFRTPDGRVKVR